MVAKKSQSVVCLKKLCGELNVDPRKARRILRMNGDKPAGRWEWPASKVEAIKKLLVGN